MLCGAAAATPAAAAASHAGAPPVGTNGRRGRRAAARGSGAALPSDPSARMLTAGCSNGRCWEHTHKRHACVDHGERGESRERVSCGSAAGRLGGSLRSLAARDRPALAAMGQPETAAPASGKEGLKAWRGAPAALRPSDAPCSQAYYKSKIEAAEVLVRDKTANLRRLEAQRNELNTKGERGRGCRPLAALSPLRSAPAARGAVAAARAGQLRGRGGEGDEPDQSACQGEPRCAAAHTGRSRPRAPQVHPEGKYVVSLDKSIAMADVKPAARVRLSLLAFVCRSSLPRLCASLLNSASRRWRCATTRTRCTCCCRRRWIRWCP